jgi:hypothetical protein
MEEENKTIEERVVIELTTNELEVVFRGLLELPSKFSLTVIQGIQAQVYPQFKAREEVKNDSTDTEGV